MQQNSAAQPAIQSRAPAFCTRWIVRLILIGFAVLGIWYSLVVPPFETPDEIYHYAFARHLAMGNPLPVQDVEHPGPWEHEGAQAPLYYLLLSRLIAPIDQRDFEDLIVTNPRANLGNPHYPGNKNFMLYSSEWPANFQTGVAVLVGRWFSLALIVIALWLTYGTARLAFGPGSGAVAALCVAAAIPQLAFVGAGVSNDALIILASVATIYWLCVLVSRADDAPPGMREWVILGVLLALAALSKLQGLGLYIPAGLVILLVAWRRRERGLFVRAVLIVGGLGVALAGWWYVRNFLLYGDFLATRPLLEIEGLRTEAHELGEFWGELRGLRYSFWGLFGWFSILFPSWFYVLLDGVTLLAVGGLAALARRRIRKLRAQGQDLRAWLDHAPHRVYLVLAVWLVVLGAAMLYWLTFAISSQGRLLLPGISAVAILLVLGLGHTSKQVQLWLLRGVDRLRGKTRRAAQPRPVWGIALLPLILLACSLYAVLYLLPGYYTRPQPVTMLPPDAVLVNRVYGDRLELVAVEVPHAVIEAESYIEVTLYVRKLQETGHDYELFVQLLDHQIKEIANVTTHPGWGTNPTSLWEVGEIYPDTYRLFVEMPETMPEAPDHAEHIGEPDGAGDAGDGDQNEAELTLDARLFVGFRTQDEELLEVPGYEWDIESMTVKRVPVLLE